MQRGRFITLEGVDGAGKSTHIPAIAEGLRCRGREVLVTREPGGTPLGEKLRDMLLHQAMAVETEALLMFAARKEHLVQTILPALERGVDVLSDRFTDASFAYQGAARGLATQKIAQLEQWVHGGFQPDLTLLFDVPVKVSLQRLANTRHPDRFEREQAPFFQRIREGYLARARQDPSRFRIINADRPLEMISAEIESIIASL